MSNTCDYCHKGRLKGHKVSHAKNRHIRHFLPNLHPHKVMEEGKKISRNLCSKCWKTWKRESLETQKHKTPLRAEYKDTKAEIRAQKSE